MIKFGGMLGNIQEGVNNLGVPFQGNDRKVK